MRERGRGRRGRRGGGGFEKRGGTRGVFFIFFL